MAFIIPNATDTASGAKYENLDQAEPDSLDFEILGNNGRSGVLSGCAVTSSSSVSAVTVASGTIVLNGVPYLVAGDASLGIPASPTSVRYDAIVVRVSSGTATLTVVQGNDDPTNPRYPNTAAILAPGVTFDGNVHIDLETDVVLATIYRESGETSITSSRIVDKRTLLTSSVIDQGTAAPSGGSTGSLYYKNDTASGSSGTGVFIKNASGAWIETAQLANNNITNAQLRDSAGLSVIGRSTNSAGDPADIVAASDGQVLRRSGTSLDFGQITGAGIASSTISEDKLVAALIEKLIPAGTIAATIRTTADSGWLMMGQTVAGAQSLYPALWAAVPPSWRSGSSLVLPSMANRVLAGQSSTALGATGGSNTTTIGTTNLPKHQHTLGDHDHTLGNHDHTLGDHDHTLGDHDHSIEHNHPSETFSVSGAVAAEPTTYVYRLGGGYSTNYVAGYDGNNDGLIDGLGVGAQGGMAVQFDADGHSHGWSGSVAVDLGNFTGTSGKNNNKTGKNNGNTGKNNNNTGKNNDNTGDGGFSNTALDVRNAHVAVNFQIKAH